MVDTETFLTTLYVMIEECGQAHLPPEVHPGPQASLSRSEVLTLRLCGPWACFPSERAFCRDAQRQRRVALPTLPHRTRFTRLLRQPYAAIVACFLPLVDLLDGRDERDEALDGSAGPTREAKRRGAGWLPGLAESGGSNRLGWDEGFPLLMAVNPRGSSTGSGVGPASAEDHPLAATFFAWRQRPHPGCRSVGKPALGPSVGDQGCEGHTAPRRWWRGYGAQV